MIIKRNFLIRIFDSPLSFYCFFFIFAIIVPIVLSFIPTYAFHSSNSYERQLEIWFEYGYGFVLTSITLSFLFYSSKAFQKQIIILLLLFSTPLKYALILFNKLSLQSKKVLPLVFKIIILLLTILLLYQSLSAYIHHANNNLINLGGLRGRYYPNPRQIAIYYLGTASALTLSFLKLKTTKILSITALASSVIGQALDLSRYSLVSATITILVIFIISKDNPLESMKSLFSRGVIRKSSIFTIPASISLLVLTLVFLNQRMSYLNLLAYFTSFSFYNIASFNASDICNNNVIQLIANLSGLPISILNKLGLGIESLRLDLYRPMPGFDYLNCIFKSPLLVGCFLSFLLFPIALLTHLTKSKISVNIFVYTLILIPTITFYQYDFRMTLRILQICLLPLLIVYNYTHSRVKKTNTT